MTRHCGHKHSPKNLIHATKTLVSNQLATDECKCENLLFWVVGRVGKHTGEETLNLVIDTLDQYTCLEGLDKLHIK